MGEPPSGKYVEPVAVVGFSFRFGGEATSADSFWDMITSGRCAVSPIPKDRFNADAFYHPDTNRLDRLPVKYGNFVTEDIAAFDAPFFGVKAAEAAAMDPQSRKLLEATYRALENAGIPVEKCAGSKTCVFTGVSADDYRLMYSKDPSHAIRHAATGMAISMLANKISWFYDFKGPSVQLDTACSASLNALHLACRSIWSGESDMGIVGGANLYFTPESMAPLAHMNFFSPDSRCYSFDHRANGYSRGDGYGVFVLKPLSRALADHDPIRAVIRSTASNENGRTVGGITKVNFDAQRTMVNTAYQKAGLDPALTRYVEAHAPGTEGDIVESLALGSVFSKHRSKKEPLYMGSVKANLGHLEGTSGIASLVKVILMLERGIIPRLANFEKLNPRILGNEWKMAFPTENTPWPAGTRQASINSFGFGGSNAHVVVQEGNEYNVRRPYLKPTVNGTSGSARTERESASHPLLLAWSTADEGGSGRIKFTMEQYFAQKGPFDWAAVRDLAYTLAVRRSKLAWKSFLVVPADRNHDAQLSMQELSKPVRSLNSRPLAFVFTGQGAPWARMGSQFFYNEVFRESLTRCAEYLNDVGSTWNPIEELLTEESSSRVAEPEYSQPLCTALQIALVDMMKNFGVRPAFVIGHSSGEIAAAYATSAISARSACRIAYFRGQIISKHFKEEGRYGMLVVGLSEVDIAKHMERLETAFEISEVYVACVNSPRNVTLSGDLVQLQTLKSTLEKESIFVRQLAVPAPYHSLILQQFADEYEALLQDLESGALDAFSPKMVSSVTMQPISGRDLCTTSYWAENLISPVQFQPALDRLAFHSSPVTPGGSKTFQLPALVEIGPYGALRTSIRDTLKATDAAREVLYFSVMDRAKLSEDRLFDTLGHLHCLGYPVDLAVVNDLANTSVRCLTDLPEYPFNHSKSYWHESQISRNHRFRKYARHDLLGLRVHDWNPLAPRWRNTIRVLENPWIEDHRLGGALIYPGAGMLVMAIEAAAQYVKDFDDSLIRGFQFTDVSLHSALNVTTAPEGTVVEFSLIPSDDRIGRSNVPTRFGFEICVSEEENWREVCHGTIAVEFEDLGSSPDMAYENHHKETDRLQEFETRLASCSVPVGRHKLYQRFKRIGLDLGPTFQVFDNVRYDRRGGLAAADIRLKNWTLKGNAAHTSSHFVHPTALDGMLQLLVAALGAGAGKPVPAMVPNGISSMWVSADGLSTQGHVTAVSRSDFLGFRNTRSSVWAYDVEQRTPRIIIDGLETIIIKSENTGSQAEETISVFKLDWKPDLGTMSTKALQTYCLSSTQLDSAGFQPLARYLDLLRHRNPQMRVLEIRPSFVEDQAALTLWGLLHSSDTVHSQGPDAFGRYDLAVDGNAQHDDPVLESIARSERASIIDISSLGLGSWSGEENREYDIALTELDASSPASAVKMLEPLICPGGRLVILTQTDPDGAVIEEMLEVFTLEAQLPYARNSRGSEKLEEFIVTILKKTVVEPFDIETQPCIVITAVSHSSDQLVIAQSVQQSLFDFGLRNIDIVDWKETRLWKLPPYTSKKVHFLCLHSASSEDTNDGGSDVYLALKCILTFSKSIMWVTMSSESKSNDLRSHSARCGSVAGLSRTIRNEYPEIQFITLNLDDRYGKTINASQAILQAFQPHRFSSTETYEPEYHYGVFNGVAALQVPRLRYSPADVEHVEKSSIEFRTISRPFSSPHHPPLKLTITSPGLLDTLTFITEPRLKRSLLPTEALIQPVYVGLNFLDVLTALGRIPQISVLGIEGAGTVLEVGSATDLRSGDRVAVLTDGTLRSVICADYRCTVKIPEHISLRDAASLAGTACTVYRALIDIAHLEAGETILIHAGAGATGQMGVQLAQHVGAEVYVTVGSEKKRSLVQETYGILPDHIFNSRNASFIPGVKRMTGNRGVDVVLNSLAGELLESAWSEVVAPFGRWIELGKRDILDNKGLSMRPLLQNVTFSCVDLTGIWQQRPAMMRKLLENVFKLVADGTFRPPTPVTEFEVGQIQAAFRSLQNGQEGGKVVVNMCGDEEVLARQDIEPSWHLRGDRSYLIVGGLGGLGRGLARWMVHRGAKSIIILSRSGVGKDPERLALLQELEEAGCIVDVRQCNIADKKALEGALQECERTTLPIAGCIQASMVLRVSITLVKLTLN